MALNMREVYTLKLDNLQVSCLSIPIEKSQLEIVN